jgi:hypothetical protein
MRPLTLSNNYLILSDFNLKPSFIYNVQDKRNRQTSETAKILNFSTLLL